MTYISTKLRERGINVLIVPEFATMLANGGGLINIHKMNMQQIIKLQVCIVKRHSESNLFCSVCDNEGDYGIRGSI